MASGQAVEGVGGDGLPDVVVDSIPRPGFRGSEDGELRISIREFEGHQFIEVRLFTAGRDRVWRPSKKGVSVRLKEARPVASAILEALGRTGWSPDAERPGGSPRSVVGPPPPGRRPADPSFAARRRPAPEPGPAHADGWYSRSGLREPRRKGPEVPTILPTDDQLDEAERRRRAPWDGSSEEVGTDG